MAVNRLSPKKKSRDSLLKESECYAGDGSLLGFEDLALKNDDQNLALEHEAVEVSLCDEGMCFFSEIQHAIGTVLLVNFEPELAGTSQNELSLKSEAVVVDCQGSTCRLGFDITVLFMGN